MGWILLVFLLALGPGAAFADWRGDAPGREYRLLPRDLPPPFATGSASLPSEIAPLPPAPRLKLPPGFEARLWARGLDQPRLIRFAPNGDLFVAESNAGRLRLLRSRAPGTKPVLDSVFAEGLELPFGMAFYPAGPDPHWLYVAETNAILRFAYRNGDVKARAAPETVVARLAPAEGGSHWTRSLAFSADGRRLFVSVGSESNASMSPDEKFRADVLSFNSDGSGRAVFAAGLRNCVGLAVQPGSGTLWCSNNERDGLGDDLPPDFVTRVREGGFYGWPYYYIGSHEDPRRKGERPDLADKVDLPDVLIEAHSAPLDMAFYEGSQFPEAYRGDLFLALHGSWNRKIRTGYKIVRIRLKDGKPTGTYEDFVTGWVLNDRQVAGRPVGVAVAPDGALMVSEDANGTIWRISYK